MSDICDVPSDDASALRAPRASHMSRPMAYRTGPSAGEGRIWLLRIAHATFPYNRACHFAIIKTDALCTKPWFAC